MRRPLTAVFVKSVAKPGKYGDRHGLILQVRPTGSKYWFWRGTVRGKRVDYGIGSYPYVTLAEARQTAFEYRKLSKTGADPKALNAAPAFEEALEKVLAIHRTTWKPGSRTEEQWRRELTVYAFPHIGRKRVNEVTTADVMRVLLADHLWTEKPVVAKRLRQRISAVMKWAVAQGFRENNPAGDAVGAVLPRHNGSTTHFRALPHRRVGEAIATVRESNTWRGIKLAFEFMVLTAARTVEVRLATWDEIDMDAARWTIPPEHMKAKREHRVPLSPRAVELLGEAAERFGSEGLLFPGPRGKPLSETSVYKMLTRLAVPSTAHGFRSSFRDWAAEKTDHPREVVEAALAHVVKNKVEAAYRRTDLFERRRRLMDEWAEYLAGRRESTAAYRL